MAKTLIKNAEIITAKDTDKYYIGILDDTIQVISKELPQGYENAQIIDAEGKIAVPGMVNTHTHAAMTLLRSYADDMVLMDWLQNKIWPAEDGLTDDDIYWGTMLSIAEMLKNRETKIKRIVAVYEDGSILPPCGRCRELMSQLDLYNENTMVVVDFEKEVRLKELLPERWDKKWD